MRDRRSRQQPKDLPIEPTTGTTETDIPIQTPGAPRAGQPAHQALLAGAKASSKRVS
ncbi:MAG: hypothetical protein M3315_10255 [Actinomycetota bacterium]|jgi:hypothetical protein|nr:hypothetical protein [Actinomycetota bacterium]